MAYDLTVTYEEGNKLIAGEFTGDPAAPLVADTYYQGMPLKYEIDGTAAVVGTGNGTATDITAGSGVAAGDYTCTFTGALDFDLADPAGNILGQFSVPNGGALDINADGLIFTITDGSTAWIATDVVTITIGTGGKYEYNADLTLTDAFYNGADARVLASAGYGAILKSGEIYEAGIVDGSGTAITLTEATIAALGARGFNVRRTA